MKVGIPRGLFFYYYYPLWKTFFNDLGAEVIVSRETCRFTMDQGIEMSVDEICLPVKVYFGHVRELCGQKLDYLFAPRLVSVEPKAYICPKFMGIPDMLAACIKGLPPLIDITVDVSKTNKYLQRDIERIGALFNCSKRQAERAFAHGRFENYRCLKIAQQGYTMAEAIRIWEGQERPVSQKGDLNICVLGHGYSLYDDHISMNLISRLRNMGCNIHMVETFAADEIEKEAAHMPKRVFWTLGRKLVGTALHMEKRPEIDGIVYLACFGCGPDSLIGEIIERRVQNKPFMLVTVDEHTGEGGVLTRLEAFCDMLRRRRMQDEGNLSPHGECLYSH
ncbi:acyl-CoA dehydratase activase-related protein [Syntrophomonas palmitatica]|uniref:acyl-CoA dehydratase activase-related protein n=1 Tax=Syntrophomonas palmitatica TaxID=402877 RepID=UPI0006D126E8|nr:acyl-CoA dehydratase activase-related protein [Syntrophomonas palmitatica]